MKARDWMMKMAFTAFFLAWEAGNRIKGAWRRREWRSLARYAVRLAIVAFLAIAAAVACTGCTVVPAATAHRACELLQTASDEADLAPAWYSRAGEVLERCGQPEARATGEWRACKAEARSGYRDSAECEALQ